MCEHASEIQFGPGNSPAAVQEGLAACLSQCWGATPPGPPEPPGRVRGAGGWVGRAAMSAVPGTSSPDDLMRRLSTPNAATPE